MAHVDISQKIEFVLEDQKITLEEAYADLLKPLAATVGGHAKLGDANAVEGFEQVFAIIIQAAKEILDEKENKSG